MSLIFCFFDISLRYLNYFEILYVYLNTTPTKDPALREEGDVNRTTSKTSSSNSKTTVKINQNGEEKTFESTGEDISYQSQDGTTKVEVKGNSTKTDVNSATKVQKSSGEHKETEESEDKNSDTQKSSSSEKRISFFDYIKIKIISFFSLSSRD